MKKYPNYCPSGIEWLGEIPVHWEISKLKFYVSIKSGEFLSNHAINSTGVYPVYGGNGIVGYTKEFNENGDAFIIGRVGAKCGNIHYTRKKIWVTDNSLILKTKITEKYMYYFLLSQNFNKLANQNAQPLITGTMIRNHFFLICNSQEQQQIAVYLDKKTSQIDTYIEKKQKEIALLKEQRAALINHAVTKGLDPNVKMKASGIEWLGDIPTHWEVKKLKYLINFPLQYGANESAEFEDRDLPRYIRITDIRMNGELRNDIFKSIDRIVAAPYILKDGDLLFARSGATVGKSFLYQQKYGEAAFAGYLIRASINKEQTNPIFISYFTNSNTYWQWLLSMFIQSTIQNVSAEKYSSLYIHQPPLSEQQQIASYLDKKTTQIDNLVDKIEKQIEFVKEYRTTLISDAVTGKIDVRGEQ